MCLKVHNSCYDYSPPPGAKHSYFTAFTHSFASDRSSSGLCRRDMSADNHRRSWHRLTRSNDSPVERWANITLLLLMASGSWPCVTWQTGTRAAQEHKASIFMVTSNWRWRRYSLPKSWCTPAWCHNHQYEYFNHFFLFKLNAHNII